MPIKHNKTTINKCKRQEYSKYIFTNKKTGEESVCIIIIYDTDRLSTILSDENMIIIHPSHI